MRRALAAVVVILCCASTATAALPLSGERPVSTASPAPAAFDQSSPLIASDGRGFLAAWNDSRSRAGGPADLYISRLDSAGNLVEPLNRKLVSGYTPRAIVWGGSEFVIAAIDAQSGIALIRVNPDGTLRAAPLVVAGDSSGPVRLTSNGNGYGLVWADRATPGSYRAILFDADMNRINTLNLRSKPSVLANALVAYNSAYVFLYEERLNTAGCPPDGCPRLRRLTIPVTTLPQDSIIYDNMPVANRTYAAVVGNQYILLAWHSDNSGARTIEYAFIGDDISAVPTLNSYVYYANLKGRVLDSTNLLSAGWDGKEYVITFPAVRDIASDQLAAARVSETGAALDFTPITISTAEAQDAVVAASSTQSVLLWTERSTGNRYFDLFERNATSFSQLLRSSTTTALARSASYQNSVSLASNGSGALAVWREFDVRPAIMAGPVGGSSPFVVSDRSSFDQTSPAAAPLDGSYLVVWREERESTFRILGKRVGASGSPIDASPIVIASESRGPYTFPIDTIDVASDGGTALVVWSGGDHQIHGARVNSSGTLLDPTPLVVSRSGIVPLRLSPHVVSTAGGFVVAWSEDLNDPRSAPSPVRSAIYATRVTASGSVDAASRLVATGGFNGQSITLAATSTRIMVAWTAGASAAGVGRCLFVQTLTNDLTPLGAGDTASFCRSDDQAPADLDLVRDGDAFILFVRERGDINAYRLSASGQIVESFPISATALDEFGPSATPMGSQIAIAYSRVSDAADHGNVARIFTRTLGVPPPSRQRAVRH